MLRHNKKKKRLKAKGKKVDSYVLDVHVYSKSNGIHDEQDDVLIDLRNRIVRVRHGNVVSYVPFENVDRIDALFSGSDISIFGKNY